LKQSFIARGTLPIGDIETYNSLMNSRKVKTDKTFDIKSKVTDIFKNIFAVFINVVIEFNIVIIKLIDTQGKMSAIIASILQIMTTVQYTFESMWNGIPGDIIRFMPKLM
jgi:hypothetical protein